MELTPSPSEGGAEGKTPAPPSLLMPYVALTAVVGMGLSTLVAIRTEWSTGWLSASVWTLAFLAIAAVVGEVKPLIISSRGQERSLSTSAPFLLALMAVAGVGIAVTAQAIASLADDIHRRSSMAKSIFNTAQYVIAVIAGRAVYSLVSGEPMFAGPTPFESSHLGALLAGGLTMIAVNWVVVAGVVAIASRAPFWVVLKEDLRTFLLTNVVLLSIGGLATVIAEHGVVPLALLATPVIAAHIFAAAAAKHAHDAKHDALTGLLNRGQLDFALTEALKDLPEGTGGGPGLVVLDLDHFRDINDALGHPVGDRILADVATRLSSAAPEGAPVHRLGGDEFAVVLPGPLADIRAAAAKLVGALDDPVTVDGIDLLVRASAGVAIAPQHGADAPTLLKNADIALYHAKLERDRVSTYSPGFDVNSVERLKLLGELRVGIEAGQLALMYQPQVDLRDGRTVGVEALVRWNHPERGRVAPDEFIPLAENSGLIFPLTAFVLDTALGQLATWRQQGYDLRMAVNLSARHLSDMTLPDQVTAAAQRHGVPHDSIVLEVTETAILADPIRADSVIKTLRDRGVEVSIDDYGTGNASLSYLKRLEVDELKVDRSFVSSLGRDPHDLIIVKSTIALGVALGLRVVAEGIEDGKTTAALAEIGGVIGQGYHLGRPTLASEIDKRLDAERKVHGAAGSKGKG